MGDRITNFHFISSPMTDLAWQKNCGPTQKLYERRSRILQSVNTLTSFTLDA